MAQNFFDSNPHAEVLIPMYGTIHFIALAVMLSFIPLMIWKKEAIKRLSSNRRFMVGVVVAFLSVEAIDHVLLWAFDYQPFPERFPLHLCPSMSLVIPILYLAKRYNAVRFFSFWALGGGFISLVNPSFLHDAPVSWAFFQYNIRHYFLFLFPTFLIIGQGFHMNYRLFLKSMFTLMGYATLMFFVNWGLGTNYMHLGQHNKTPIPFLPDNLSVWPYTLPSFVITGIIIFHVFYLVFYLSTRNSEKVIEEITETIDGQIADAVKLSSTTRAE